MKIHGGTANDSLEIQHIKFIEKSLRSIIDNKPQRLDQFAMYVHQGGTYTVELVDSTGSANAFDVDPCPENESITLEIGGDSEEGSYQYGSIYIENGSENSGWIVVKIDGQEGNDGDTYRAAYPPEGTFTGRLAGAHEAD